MANFPHHCGLERLTAVQIQRDVLGRQRQLVDLVLEAQVLFGRGSTRFGRVVASNAERAECIRRRCENVSRPSRLMARYLAIVQEESLLY